MPAVFVHGVPDTAHVWHKVIDRIDRTDVVTLDLPGFEHPRPAGWGATMNDYAGWVIEQLEALDDGPIDLVGHDWGSLLTIRVASLRSDLLQSWATGNGPVDETYTWHDTAQAWQTPELGEQVMSLMTPETMGPALAEGGLDIDDANATAAHISDDMKSCILDLYRSAKNVGADWGPDVDNISAPGLVIWGQNDDYVPAVFGERLANRTNSRLVPLDCGHWWPLMKPDETAAALTSFWSER